MKENPIVVPTVFLSNLFHYNETSSSLPLKNITDVSGNLYLILINLLISFAGYEGEACEDDKVVPSAPPMDLMDHFTGYEQLSFEAGKYTHFVSFYVVIM